MSKIDIAFRTAIDEVNCQLPASVRLSYSDDQPLAGDDSPLDSLGVLLFVTALESSLRTQGFGLDLVNLLMDVDNAPVFSNIGSLRAYLVGRA